MTLKNVILGVVTLGGHERLKNAQERQREACEIYQKNLELLEKIDQQIAVKIENLGAITIQSFKILKKAQRLLALNRGFRDHAIVREGTHTSFDMQNTGYSNLNSVINGYSGAYPIVGLGIGSTVAVGSWSLVALAGTASTGTAISSLTGVAATNATLAYFGGGALAAGGAGMAGGTLVLGGIVIAPVIVLAAWQTRAKSKKIEAQIIEIESETNRIVSTLPRREEMLNLTSAELVKISDLSQALTRDFDTAIQLLLPYRFVSFFLRWLKSWLGYAAFTENELITVRLLEQAVFSFIKPFKI